MPPTRRSIPWRAQKTDRRGIGGGSRSLPTPLPSLTSMGFCSATLMRVRSRDFEKAPAARGRRRSWRPRRLVAAMFGRRVSEKEGVTLLVESGHALVHGVLAFGDDGLADQIAFGVRQRVRREARQLVLQQQRHAVGEVLVLRRKALRVERAEPDDPLLLLVHGHRQVRLRGLLLGGWRRGAACRVPCAAASVDEGASGAVGCCGRESASGLQAAERGRHRSRRASRRVFIRRCRGPS